VDGVIGGSRIRALASGAADLRTSLEGRRAQVSSLDTSDRRISRLHEDRVVNAIQLPTGVHILQNPILWKRTYSAGPSFLTGIRASENLSFAKPRPS